MTEKIQDLVSIIVPVYNTAPYLSDCLESLITQTYANLEILCVDDGSTDNSLSILHSYAKKDRRVSVIVQKNRGQAHARNTGLRIARGTYVSFIDSDDIIDKQCIEKALHIFEYCVVTAVIYNMEMFHPNNIRYLCFSGTLFPNKNCIINTEQHELCLSFTNAAPVVFARKNLIENFPEGMIYEDWVFMAQYMSKSRKIFWLNEPLYKYRRGFTQSTTSNTSSKCLDLFKAWRLSQDIVAKSAKKAFAYIYDVKILNEGAGFIEARFLNIPFSSLTNQFFTELHEIMTNYAFVYFYYLISYVTPFRKLILETIWNFSDIVQDDYLPVFTQIKKKLFFINKKNKIKYVGKRYVKSFFLWCKSFVQFFYMIVFPTYRISLSIKHMLETHMADTRHDLWLIKNMIKKLQNNTAYTDEAKVFGAADKEATINALDEMGQNYIQNADLLGICNEIQKIRQLLEHSLLE